MISADILVIGGGLAGCATAYYLARAGAAVTLIEQYDLSTQASGSNAGSLHAQIPHEPFLTEGPDWARNFAPTIRLLKDSIALWQGLETELDADLEVSVKGGLLVAETEEQMRDVARKAALERAHGLDVDLIGTNELRRLAPYLSPQMIGGAFCAGEGKANPLKATPAFARAAQRHGARLITRCTLEGLARAEGFWQARTSGEPISARIVVNCAGAAAGRVAALLGLDLAIEGHPIQVNVTEPAQPFIPHLVYAAGDKLTLKQARNGTLLIGGGWPARWSRFSDRPVVDFGSLRGNLAVAQSVVPAVGSLRLLRVWPAIVNGTKDWRPILGEVPGLPGFFMNMFPWMGFTAGPIAARTTAELVLGRTPSIDVREFAVLPKVA